MVKRFYGVTDQRLPLHLLPFALSSFFGPLLLGRLFDRVGRWPMIAATYGISGLVLGGTAGLFAAGVASTTQLSILQRRLLHRLVRRERRLPDGERDLPPRGSPSSTPSGGSSAAWVPLTFSGG